MIRRPLFTALLTGLFVACLALCARAESAPLAARARAKANAGYAAFQRQDYERALQLFREANTLIDAPTHRLYIARTQVNLGRLVAAAEAYRQIAETELPPTAPEAFHTAREEARAEIEALQPRIPRLTVAVSGEGGASVQVIHNGAPVPVAVLGKPVAVDPGEHVVEASGTGLSCGDQTVRLVEGAEQRVVLRCEPLQENGAVVSSPVSPSVSQPGPALTDTDADAGLTSTAVAGWAAIGVGVAGVGVGVPLLLRGLEHRAAADELYHECTPGGCSDGEKRWYRDRLQTSDVLVISGVASAALGVVGLVTGTTLLTSSSASDDSARVQIEPWITMGSVGLSGRF